MTYPKEMNIKMMYYSYHRGDDTDIQGMLRILCIVCMKFLLWQDHFHLNRSMDIWQVASSRHDVSPSEEYQEDKFFLSSIWWYQCTRYIDDTQYQVWYKVLCVWNTCIGEFIPNLLMSEDSVLRLWIVEQQLYCRMWLYCLFEMW